MESNLVIDIKEYLKKQSISYIDCLFDQRISQEIEAAYNYILDSYSGKIINPDNDYRFIASCFLLKFLRSTGLIKRFSLSYASGIEKIVFQRLKSGEDQIGSVKVSYDRTEACISIPDYLKRSVEFNDKSWKLINQKTDNGFVFLEKKKLARLFRSEIMTEIENQISNLDIVNKTDDFNNYVNKLYSISYKQRHAIYKPSTFPPCIEHIIKDLNNGVNVSNTGRFFLAAFFFKRGKRPEDLKKYFVNAPDYSEKVTMYHLKKIYNGEYMCNSCETLRISGLCHKIPRCGEIKNPLQFK